MIQVIPRSTAHVVFVLLMALEARAEPEPPATEVVVTGSWCDDLPRESNAKLPLSDASDAWFQVYESAEGVFSIIEPFQFQETISHLIVGTERALLFDTGIGLVPISRVVHRITDLPIQVLNSHTHYDHVGGNSEFETVLAFNSEYTRANMAGFGHDRIGEDFVPEAFCTGPPEGSTPDSFHTKAWRASRHVEGGEILDLGGRKLEVLHVPGHTPDAIALLDAENGLLFTGDTYYEAQLWLFVPETSLGDYERSLSRLASLEGELQYLLGAHNLARMDAGRLSGVKAALQKLRSGEVVGQEGSGHRLSFEIDGVRFLTAEPVLRGEQGDASKGGSGLDTWPAPEPADNLHVDPVDISAAGRTRIAPPRPP